MRPPIIPRRAMQSVDVVLACLVGLAVILLIVGLFVFLWWLVPNLAHAEQVIAYYHFNEPSGSTTFADSSGNGHVGSCSGTTCPTAALSASSGMAATFAGAQYVQVTGTAALKQADAVAIQAKITATTAPTNGAEVASMGDSYALRVLANGNVRFLFYRGGGNYSFLDTTAQNVLDNLPHLIKGVKLPTGLEIWIDDKLKSSSSVTGAIDYSLGQNFNIGRHANDYPGRYFSGGIDEVKISIPDQGDVFAGGFVEPQGTAPRSKLSTATISAFLPTTRTSFQFPAPYNTTGYRITIAGDCGAQDCVDYVGYPYWARLNAHVSEPIIYIMVGLNPGRGGAGPTLFQFDKATGTVTKWRNLFPVGTPEQATTGEHWYFSLRQPHTLYFPRTYQVMRYDFVLQTFAVAVSILDRSYTQSNGTLTSFGCTAASCPRALFQTHVNGDDTVFAGTLNNASGTALGCWVYRVPQDQFRFYPETNMDECNIDKSGQYTITFVPFGTVGDAVGNKIYDNTTGQLIATKSGPSGTLGHHDLGYGYALGSDNNGPVPVQPNSTTRFDLPAATPAVLMHYNNNWNQVAINHISHTNAVPAAVRDQANQYACGSWADTVAQANEITCARVDGAAPLEQLIVAPIMTDMNAAGGGLGCGDPTYCKAPKGMLDVTGQYFLWTSNAGGSRLDAYLVKVPGQLLVNLRDVTAPAPPGLSVAMLKAAAAGTAAFGAGLGSWALWRRYGAKPQEGGTLPRLQ